MYKVFFGYSIKGNYELISSEKIKHFNKIINELNLKIIPKQDVDAYKIASENYKDKTLMHDQEYQKLIKTDFAIFEISNPGITIGAQISDLIHMKTPILCLYRNDLYNIIPRYILGKEDSKYINSTFIVSGYDNEEEISRIIKEFIKNYIL